MKKWFKLSTNKTEQPKKTPSTKPIALSLADKQEPFGSISIEQIKATLEEEDFSKLQSLFFVMMRDLKIASAVLTRQQQLAGLSFSVESDNQAFVDWINERSNKIKLPSLINSLSTGIYCGVSLIDVSYELFDGMLKPNFNLVSPRYLHAHKDKLLKTTAQHLYIKKDDKKLFINSFDKDKVIFHKHAIDIGEITDFSLASKLVWYFSLKHIVLAHNLQYFDHVATPPLVAKSDGDSDDVVESLYDLKSASVGVFGKDDIIEYLKIGNQAQFLEFIEYIDRQIATLILGNTLSTGEGKNGSRSQSEVHEQRQKEILRFDASLIEQTVEDYLNRLEALNFATPKGVKFSFDIKDKKDLKELSEVVKNIADAGFELDAQDLEKQFGLKITGKKEPLPIAKNQQSNSCECPSCKSIETNNAQHKAKPVDYLDEQNPNTKTAENILLNAIETAVKEATSYEEAMQNLLETYADMDVAALEALFFKQIANSQILATAEIENESGN